MSLFFCCITNSTSYIRQDKRAAVEIAQFPRLLNKTLDGCKGDGSVSCVCHQRVCKGMNIIEMYSTNTCSIVPMQLGKITLTEQFAKIVRLSFDKLIACEGRAK